MVREWAHNPTLNGSIPNSSRIKKLSLTKSIFSKNKNKVTTKKLVNIKISGNLVMLNYSLLLSKYLHNIQSHNTLGLQTSNASSYMYLSIIYKLTRKL